MPAAWSTGPLSALGGAPGGRPACHGWPTASHGHRPPCDRPLNGRSFEIPASFKQARDVDANKTHSRYKKFPRQNGIGVSTKLALPQTGGALGAVGGGVIKPAANS